MSIFHNENFLNHRWLWFHRLEYVVISDGVIALGAY